MAIKSIALKFPFMTKRVGNELKKPHFSVEDFRNMVERVEFSHEDAFGRTLGTVLDSVTIKAIDSCLRRNDFVIGRLRE